MRRCFSQKKELFANLENLEFLFEENEINCYHFLKEKLELLKQFTEKSGVWLDNI